MRKSTFRSLPNEGTASKLGACSNVSMVTPPTQKDRGRASGRGASPTLSINIDFKKTTCQADGATGSVNDVFANVLIFRLRIFRVMKGAKGSQATRRILNGQQEMLWTFKAVSCRLRYAVQPVCGISKKGLRNTSSPLQ